MEIEGKAGEIKFSVDDIEEWSYIDPDPILSGSFAFETQDGCKAEIDDVEVKIQNVEIEPAATVAIPGELKLIRTG